MTYIKVYIRFQVIQTKQSFIVLSFIKKSGDKELEIGAAAPRCLQKFGFFWVSTLFFPHGDKMVTSPPAIEFVFQEGKS